jgi:hypothetical protein
MAARRAPRPEERGKAAEQTRERILEAAVAEFGAKGYAGARTAGEVSEEIDPQFALLVAYAVIFSPITMPQFVRDIFGDNPLSSTVRHTLHSQLVKLLGASGD